MDKCSYGLVYTWRGLKGDSLGWKWELTGGLEAGLLSCQNKRMKNLPLIQFTTRTIVGWGQSLLRPCFRRIPRAMTLE